jgi:hypothetical protein
MQTNYIKKSILSYLIPFYITLIIVTLFWWYYTLPTKYSDNYYEIYKPTLRKILNRFFMFYSPCLISMIIVLIYIIRMNDQVLNQIVLGST